MVYRILYPPPLRVYGCTGTPGINKIGRVTGAYPYTGHLREPAAAPVHGYTGTYGYTGTRVHGRSKIS